jgi:large subunit ribosomal protein L19e
MKKLSVQKRIAGQLLKCSKNRVKLDTERIDDIREAITRRDIKSLINDRAIISRQKKGVSRGRANERHIQKTKGQRKGQGKRRGKSTARLPKKELWMKRVRTQREFLRELRGKGLLTPASYRLLYGKSKGGFFRSRRHIKLYMTEHSIVQERDKNKKHGQEDEDKGMGKDIQKNTRKSA